jgi:sugar lactone lactonase YvrE
MDAERYYNRWGFGSGDGLNQINYPWGICVDDDQTVYIADWGNHRIVEWKSGAISGRVVAGGNGPGNRSDQLCGPTDVIIDRERNYLIICDYNNRRVVRWSCQNGISGQTIISDINCYGLAMDNIGYLYVSDCERHEVRRWKIGDTYGTVVAGGNGHGNRLDQLSSPYYIFVDQDRSVYVSDYANHRVMKWKKGANEGIVVAGGQGKGSGHTQVSYPEGLFVDDMGRVYVAEGGDRFNRGNNRVTCWHEGMATVIVGGNGMGGRAHQFNVPTGLSFDRHGNLYVADCWNHRVQRFAIENS